jgi:hypothetical protein
MDQNREEQVVVLENSISLVTAAPEEQTKEESHDDLRDDTRVCQSLQWAHVKIIERDIKCKYINPAQKS